MKVKYTFYAEDGTSVTATVTGEGMDSGDKSLNKAMSIAFKYACFQVFCIPTEEMVDPDGESHEVQAKRIEYISPEQKAKLLAEINRTGVPVDAVLQMVKGAKTLDDIDAASYGAVMNKFSKTPDRG